MRAAALAVLILLLLASGSLADIQKAAAGSSARQRIHRRQDGTDGAEGSPSLEDGRGEYPDNLQDDEGRQARRWSRMLLMAIFGEASESDMSVQGDGETGGRAEFGNRMPADEDESDAAPEVYTAVP